LTARGLKARIRECCGKRNQWKAFRLRYTAVGGDRSSPALQPTRQHRAALLPLARRRVLAPSPEAREHIVRLADNFAGPAQEEVVGARLGEEGYDCVRTREDRDRLRSVLIDTYFSPETRRFVLEQSAINRGAFVYSEELLSHPEDPTVRETLRRGSAPPRRPRSWLSTSGRNRLLPSLCSVRHPCSHPRRAYGRHCSAYHSMERDAGRPAGQRHGAVQDVPLDLRRGPDRGLSGV
jgi:hypothetical protein